ncbi:unnamed protein product [Rotaria sp. Silwood2]|nr:unnamed protein product [Rotaria sp. Silwood2]
MFGKDAGKYCILIITREDDILYEGSTIKEYIERSTKPFKDLVAQCENRYLAMNNRAGKEERDDKVRTLITIVRQMLDNNQTPFYTNEMFIKAEEELRQREEAVLAQVNTEIEAKKQALRDEVTV